MSFVLSQVLTRIVTVGVALALGLVGAVIPAAPPAEAQALPDLTMPIGATKLTIRAGWPFGVVHYGRNVGNGSAPAGVLWRFYMPSGFKITNVDYSAPSGWTCTRTSSTIASCISAVVTLPGVVTRFKIDATAPTTPGTYQAYSVIDANRIVAESNENNNRFNTTLNVVP